MLVIYNNEKNKQRLYEELQKGNHLCVYYEQTNDNCIYLKNNVLISKYNCAIALPNSQTNFEKILSMYYYDVDSFYIYGENTNNSIMVFDIIK